MAPYHSIVASNLVEVALWKAKAIGLGSHEGDRALDVGEKEFQEGVKRFPRVPILWLRGAQMAEARGQLEAAKTRIRNAFQLDPHSPEIRLQLKMVETYG